MDIHCLRCDEPWDAYGVNNALDMTREEAIRFKRGEGCPSCAFGQSLHTSVSPTPLADALRAGRIVTFLHELEEGTDTDEVLELAAEFFDDIA